MPTAFMILAAILFLTSGGAASQASQPRTPTSIAESFISRIAKGEIADAYDELLRGSPTAARTAEVDVLKRQTQALLPIYGKALGFELYRQDRYGERLIRLLYIQRFEKHPIVWKFWIYNPAGAWQVNLVTFNDQLVFE